MNTKTLIVIASVLITIAIAVFVIMKNSQLAESRNAAADAAHVRMSDSPAQVNTHDGGTY